MIRINSSTAKKLVMSAGYKAVYTDTVKSNGGNSAKLSCKKEFIDKEAVIFILDNYNDKSLGEKVKNE